MPAVVRWPSYLVEQLEERVEVVLVGRHLLGGLDGPVELVLQALVGSNAVLLDEPLVLQEEDDRLEVAYLR